MTSPHDSQAMSLERFSALVDSYGTDLARIPEVERASAEALLSRSEEARRIWQEAKSLDELLEPPASLAPSPTLMKRLQGIPAREAQASNVLQFPRRTRAWASVAAAAALFLGVFTGAQDHEDDVDPFALGTAPGEGSADDAALSEFGALAFGGQLVTDLGAFEGELE